MLFYFFRLSLDSSAPVDAKTTTIQKKYWINSLAGARHCPPACWDFLIDWQVTEMRHSTMPRCAPRVLQRVTYELRHGAPSTLADLRPVDGRVENSSEGDIPIELHILQRGVVVGDDVRRPPPPPSWAHAYTYPVIIAAEGTCDKNAHTWRRLVSKEHQRAPASNEASACRFRRQWRVQNAMTWLSVVQTVRSRATVRLAGASSRGERMVARVSLHPPSLYNVMLHSTVTFLLITILARVVLENGPRDSLQLILCLQLSTDL